MKKFLFIFLFTLPLFAQPGTTIKQWTFNTFYPDTTGRHVLGDFFFGAQAGLDKSSYNNNLTATGFSANFADETVSGNPLAKDSTSIKFNGTSEYFVLSQASATDFVMSDGQDFTWALTFYMDNSFTGMTFAIGNNFYIRLSNSGFNGVGVYALWTDGVDSYVKYKNTTIFPANQWSTLVVVWDDGTGVTFYVNETEITSMVTSGTFADIGDVSATGDFYIGRILGGQYFSNTIAHGIVSRSAWTLKEVREYGNIATDWHSSSGNVSRDSSSAWYQTFDTDTLTSAIGVAGTLGNNQEWYVTITAKAKTAADTLDIYFVNKSSTQRKVVGTSWTTFTLPMGNGYNLAATDSIAIGGGSDFDFDNVVISRSTHHLKSPANRGWLGW